MKFIFQSILLLSFSFSVFAQQSAQNKKVAIYFMEYVLGENHLDLYRSVHTSDFVAHGTIDTSYTLDQDYAASQDNAKASSDMRIKVIHAVAEEDKVVVHWIVKGTHTGANRFLPAPTTSGQILNFEGITIFRMVEGKIAEEWGLSNVLEVLMKKGWLPGK